MRKKEYQTTLDEFEVIQEEILDYGISDLEPYDMFNDLIEQRWDNNIENTEE